MELTYLNALNKKMGRNSKLFILCQFLIINLIIILCFFLICIVNDKILKVARN